MGLLRAGFAYLQVGSFRPYLDLCASHAAAEAAGIDDPLPVGKDGRHSTVFRDVLSLLTILAPKQYRAVAVTYTLFGRPEFNEELLLAPAEC